MLSGDRLRLGALKARRNEYTHRFGYAIPTDEALTTLSQHAPLLEIGAGSGYWAWMLRKMGSDVVAYDQCPPSIDSETNRFHVRVRCWTDVVHGDHDAIARHPERTLFLCWPPPNDPMAFEALSRYQGDTFLYIGEAPLANNLNVTGDARFVRLLEEEWRIERTIALPNWELCWDQLYVFRRTSQAATGA